MRANDTVEEGRQRSIRSLLNKLTPDNFDTIAAKVEDVEGADARALAAQILDKATAEPSFCPVYARLAARLCTRDGALRGMLVRGCAERFATVDECEDGARRRSLGLMHAAAALFAAGLLPREVVHEYLAGLSRRPHIECFARLLRLTGAGLEGGDEHVRRLGELENPGLDSRLRFLLREVSELCQNQWAERRVVEGPQPLREKPRGPSGRVRKVW